MSTPKEHLVEWLRDAYAMEMKAVELLERQAERIESYPELSAKVKSHLAETREQVEKLERCFDILGTDASIVKNSLGKLAGNFAAFGAMFSSDEIMKDSLGSSVFERLEIASYKILIAAAEHAGYPEIATICSDIMMQEEAMAEWLDDHLPETTIAFLQRDSAGMQAKV